VEEKEYQMNVITKDFYKADVFRFELDFQNSMIDLTINNAISWDSIRIRLTKEELKGLSDFINKFLEN
jgi:hypothetical protein